jgi:hypothetical protein
MTPISWLNDPGFVGLDARFASIRQKISSCINLVVIAGKGAKREDSAGSAFREQFPPLLGGLAARVGISWRLLLVDFWRERTVAKGLLAVVWVAVGALVGALIGVAVGFVAGGVVSTVVESSSINGDDSTAILVGSITAVGCTVIGAIAGAAGAIVWAIDSRGGPEREARFGDRPEDFR